MRPTLLDALFSSRTRSRVIALFTMRPAERLYLREVARLTRTDVRSAKLEIDRLERLGVLTSEASGNRRYLEVNRAFPLYPELKAMALKTAGVGDVLRAAMARLSGIRFAFVYGSVAEGAEKPGSDLDLFIVGEVSGPLLHKALSESKTTLKREVNTSRFAVEELRARLKRRDPFVKDVLAGPKIFIIGTEDELAGAVGLRKA